MFYFLLFCSVVLGQDEYSGPQAGEALPDCELRAILGPQSPNQFKLLDDVGAAPNLIIFVHEVTRPGVGLVRTVTNYAKTRSEEGLKVNVVFLTADPTETENWMNRAQRALPNDINVSISMDGIEGPGTYGLNRKMQVTALLSKDKQVVANFAIVQPSMRTDAVQMCSEIAKLFGDTEMPTAQQLGIRGEGQRDAKGMRNSGRYEQLMRPFIQKNLTDEQVDEKAAEIEKLAMEDPALRKKIFDVTNRIINAGKLENYGTSKAQEYLTKWSKEFGDSEETTGGSDSKSKDDG